MVSQQTHCKLQSHNQLFPNLLAWTLPLLFPVAASSPLAKRLPPDASVRFNK